jgi:hypothetical protein
LVACAPMAPATRVWFSAISSFLFLFESTMSVVALETMMLVQCYYYHMYEAYSESKYRLQIFPLQRCGCHFAHVH